MLTAKGVVNGRAGTLSLIEWQEDSEAEPDQFMISTELQVKWDKSSELVLGDNDGEEILRCQLLEGGDQLRNAINACIQKTTVHEQLLDALNKIAGSSAVPVRRSLNSLISMEAVKQVLEDSDCREQLSQHIPPSLQSLNPMQLYPKIIRSAEFKRAGAELTEALYDGVPPSLFSVLGVAATQEAISDRKAPTER